MADYQLANGVVLQSEYNESVGAPTLDRQVVKVPKKGAAKTRKKNKKPFTEDPGGGDFDIDQEDLAELELELLGQSGNGLNTHRSGGTVSASSFGAQRQRDRGVHTSMSDTSKSRARSIKPHENEPFLTVGSTTPQHRQKQHVKSESGVRVKSGTVKTHRSQTPSSQGPLSWNFRSPYSSPTPSLAGRRTPSKAYISPNMSTPRANPHVKMPFKHNIRKAAHPEARPQSPSQELKEMTALATYHVNKILHVADDNGKRRQNGRLLKGRLKPLEPVNIGGPSIKQCRGIVAESRTYSASASRTLQRRRQIMMQLKAGEISPHLPEMHPTGGSDSVHRVSAASSMEDLAEGEGVKEEEKQTEGVDKDFEEELAAMEKDALAAVDMEEAVSQSEVQTDSLSQQASVPEKLGTVSRENTTLGGQSVISLDQGLADLQNPDYTTPVPTASQSTHSQDGNGSQAGNHFDSSGQAATSQDNTLTSSKTGGAGTSPMTDNGEGVTRRNNSNTSVSMHNANNNFISEGSYSKQDGVGLRRPMSATVQYAGTECVKPRDKERPKTATLVKSVRFADSIQASDGTEIRSPPLTSSWTDQKDESDVRHSHLPDQSMIKQTDEQKSKEKKKASSSSCKPTDSNLSLKDDDDDKDNYKGRGLGKENRQPTQSGGSSMHADSGRQSGYSGGGSGGNGVTDSVPKNDSVNDDETAEGVLVDARITDSTEKLVKEAENLPEDASDKQTDLKDSNSNLPGDTSIKQTDRKHSAAKNDDGSIPDAEHETRSDVSIVENIHQKDETLCETDPNDGSIDNQNEENIQSSSHEDIAESKRNEKNMGSKMVEGSVETSRSNDNIEKHRNSGSTDKTKTDGGKKPKDCDLLQERAVSQISHAPSLLSVFDGHYTRASVLSLQQVSLSGLDLRQRPEGDSPQQTEQVEETVQFSRSFLSSSGSGTKSDTSSQAVVAQSPTPVSPETEGLGGPVWGGQSPQHPLTPIPSPASQSSVSTIPQTPADQTASPAASSQSGTVPPIQTETVSSDLSENNQKSPACNMSLQDQWREEVTGPEGESKGAWEEGKRSQTLVPDGAGLLKLLLEVGSHSAEPSLSWSSVTHLTDSGSLRGTENDVTGANSSCTVNSQMSDPMSFELSGFSDHAGSEPSCSITQQNDSLKTLGDGTSLNSPTATTGVVTFDLEGSVAQGHVKAECKQSKLGYRTMGAGCVCADQNSSAALRPWTADPSKSGASGHAPLDFDLDHDKSAAEDMVVKCDGLSVAEHTAADSSKPSAPEGVPKTRRKSARHIPCAPCASRMYDSLSTRVGVVFCKHDEEMDMSQLSDGSCGCQNTSKASQKGRADTMNYVGHLHSQHHPEGGVEHSDALSSLPSIHRRQASTAMSELYTHFSLGFDLSADNMDMTADETVPFSDSVFEDFEQKIMANDREATALVSMFDNIKQKPRQGILKNKALPLPQDVQSPQGMKLRSIPRIRAGANNHMYSMLAGDVGIFSPRQQAMESKESKENQESSVQEGEVVTVKPKPARRMRQTYTHHSDQPFVYPSDDPFSSSVALRLKFGDSPYLKQIKVLPPRKRGFRKSMENASSEKHGDGRGLGGHGVAGHLTPFLSARMHGVHSSSFNPTALLRGSSKAKWGKRHRDSRVRFSDFTMETVNVNFNCMNGGSLPNQGFTGDCLTTAVCNQQTVVADEGTPVDPDYDSSVDWFSRFEALEAELMAVRSEVQDRVADSMFDRLRNSNNNAIDADDHDGDHYATGENLHDSCYDNSDDGFVYEDVDDSADEEERTDLTGQDEEIQTDRGQDEALETDHDPTETPQCTEDGIQDSYTDYYRQLLLAYRQKCMMAGEGSLVISDRLTWPLTSAPDGQTADNTSDALSSPSKTTNGSQNAKDKPTKGKRSDTNSSQKDAKILRHHSEEDSGLDSDVQSVGGGVFERSNSISSVDCDSDLFGHSNTSTPTPGERENRQQLAAGIGCGKVSASSLKDGEKLEVIARPIPKRKIAGQGEKSPVVSGPVAPFPPLCFPVNARSAPGTVFYFAYATYMNPDRLGSLLKRAVTKRYWAILFGFDLSFNKTSGSEESSGGFANIVFNPFASVEGCVFQLTPAEMDQLDAFTNSPEHYMRVVLPVWMTEVSGLPVDHGLAKYCVPAVTYIARDKYTLADTSGANEFEVGQCLKTAGELLTPAYVDHIRSFTSATAGTNLQGTV